MQICLGEGFLFSKVPFEKAIEEIRRIGYDAIELSLWSHLNFQSTDEEVKETKRVLRKHGVKAAAVLGGGPIASPDESIRRQAVESFKRQIEIAHMLDCDLVTSEMNGGTSGQREECTRAFKASMEEVAPTLEKWGVGASFEPHPGDFVEDHDSAVDILRQIGCENIGYLYCCPHTFILGEDAAAMIESAASILNHVHIADTFKMEKIVVAYAAKGYVNMLRHPEYAGAMNAHLHLVPGRGEVDFEGIFRTLKRLGYQGAVSAIPFDTEKPVEAATQSLTSIRAYMEAT